MFAPCVCTEKTLVRIYHGLQSGYCWNPAEQICNRTGVVGLIKLTLCEAADCDSFGRVRNVSQGDISLTFPDHEMNYDESFEHDCPRRISNAQGEGAEDLGDTSLTSVGGTEYCLNIF